MPTTKHLISHWPSFIGALNLTRSSLNTTRRVYFYVIVKMWFKLPIFNRLLIGPLLDEDRVAVEAESGNAAA